MQTQAFIDYPNYAGQKVLIGLSGGINSQAALCWLAQMPEEQKPAELHLFYAHLVEHSPDTKAFVEAGVAYAKRHFTNVIQAGSEGSALELFEQINMIPHPSIAPCTRLLKLEPMYAYMAEHGIKTNVVGYVKDELQRIRNMADKAAGLKKGTTKTATSELQLPSGVTAQFPIASFDNEWCFAICKREIGWYPAIYDIRDKEGNRVFKHNNCLPCKNHDDKQIADVARYYPEYMQRAKETAARIGRYWGRDADTYHTTFGRADYEVPNGQPCAVCAQD